MSSPVPWSQLMTRAPTYCIFPTMGTMITRVPLIQGPINPGPRVLVINRAQGMDNTVSRGPWSFIFSWVGTIQLGALDIHCAQGRDNTVGRGPWSFIVSRVGTIQWEEALVIHCSQGRDSTVGRGPWSFIAPRVGTIQQGALVIHCAHWVGTIQWKGGRGHSLCPG